MKPELDAIRTLVKLVTTTTTQVKDFDNLIRDHFPAEVSRFEKPAKDVRTQWNSTYDTLRTVIPFAHVFDRMSGNTKRSIMYTFLNV